MTKVLGLAIAERLEASNDSNYDGGTPSNSIFMFQSSESCLASCLAHHNYCPTPKRLITKKGLRNNKNLESKPTTESNYIPKAPQPNKGKFTKIKEWEKEG